MPRCAFYIALLFEKTKKNSGISFLIYSSQFLFMSGLFFSYPAIFFFFCRNFPKRLQILYINIFRRLCCFTRLYSYIFGYNHFVCWLRLESVVVLPLRCWCVFFILFCMGGWDEWPVNRNLKRLKALLC